MRAFELRGLQQAAKERPARYHKPKRITRARLLSFVRYVAERGQEALDSSCADADSRRAVEAMTADARNILSDEEEARHA